MNESEQAHKREERKERHKPVHNIFGRAAVEEGRRVNVHTLTRGVKRVVKGYSTYKYTK